MVVLTASWYLECAFYDDYFEIASQKSEVQEVKTGIFNRLIRYIITMITLQHDLEMELMKLVVLWC